MEDQKLREQCVSYAMELLLEYAKKGVSVSLNPVGTADKIYQYIKTGEKNEKLVGPDGELLY